MTDVALTLARLRARRAVSSANIASGAAVSAAALVCGRAIVRAGPELVLSWQDGLSPSAGDQVTLRHLTPARAALFAVVLGHCWPDADADPWPGVPTTRLAVLTSAARLGMDAKHAVGSLEVDFPELGLLAVGGEELRLGPAVSAWTPSEVEALRRVHARIGAAAR